MQDKKAKTVTEQLSQGIMDMWWHFTEVTK